MIKSCTARIAGLPVSDRVASFVNGEMMSGEIQKTTISDILDIAAKATESREEIKELLEQSRAIVWDLSDIHDNTIIRRAAGMSVSDDEFLADMRKRILAEYPALDDSHIWLYAEESEFSLGDYRISVRNLSASNIISQNPF